MTSVVRGPGLEVALRRVVVGYRFVAVIWLTILGGVLTLGGQVRVPVWVVVAAAAAAWSALTAALRWRDDILGSWWWLVVDTAVSSAVVLGPALAVGSDGAFFGGYPFSTVVLAAWSRGHPGALSTAGVLAAVSVLRTTLVQPAVAGAQVVDTAVFYLAAAAVLAWGLSVLRRNDAERRAAEEALAEERAERALAEERAETAAHLHDSVLQTLALVQRRSHEPAEITALARRQERELRAWLAGDRVAGGMFAEAIKALAADIEGAHHLTVDLVTVGEAPMGDGVRAVVAATGEALVNAAKHAGVDRVSVYAEAATGGVEVFVRDRGRGFDPTAIAEDRRGIRESICGRVERHGGTATIRSSPGSGTEVIVRMPSSR